MLKLPNKFLQQHGSKIRDGLAVLKLVAGLGRCAGLPLNLEGLPKQVVSMEEAQAVKLFEALLDSAAAEGAPSSPAVSSETLTETSVTSRTTAATGKAYRALKDLVEEQCKDPQLMNCGLEKCVAADGSVEWVAAHSKARLDPHLPPIAHSHTAPVPNARVAALSHPPAGTLPARGRQVPHLEPAQPGSLFKLELAGIKRRAAPRRRTPGGRGRGRGG